MSIHEMEGLRRGVALFGKARSGGTAFRQCSRGGPLCLQRGSSGAIGTKLTPLGWTRFRAACGPSQCGVVALAFRQCSPLKEY
jgi:hypothetical protein